MEAFVHHQNLIPEGKLPSDEFEQNYISLRNKEHRVYSDEEVAQLPDITVTHPHHQEWQIRKENSQKLLRYLAKKSKPLQVLEIGCGNGWLSAQLASLPVTLVTGTDINRAELRQASNVFSDKDNLCFLYSNINELAHLNDTFDIIVFAASIQYFSDLKATITSALALLQAGGELHITDTIFYSPNQLEEARWRTQNYFESQDAKDMQPFYFHHALTDLAGFKMVKMSNPESLWHRIFDRKNPFYWLKITK